MASPAGVDFDRNRLSQGELIAGVAGLVLFIAMLMDWYGAKVKGPLGNIGAGLGGPNAWQSFGLIDILLFLTILIAVGVAAMRALNRMPDMPYPPAVLVAGAGAIAFLLVLFRLLVQPFDVPDGVDITRKFGIYLGLLSAAGIAYGGWRAMQESGASFSDLSAGTGGAGAGGAAPSPTAPTTPMAPADPGVPGGGAAGVGEGKTGPGAPNPGTSTGAPGEEGEPPKAASVPDPVPGQTAPTTPPGIAGEPPAGEGTHPPGL